jgi:hypothetical protein
MNNEILEDLFNLKEKGLSNLSWIVILLFLPGFLGHNSKIQ